MEIPIRPKLYSFHEAFNAVGKKLFPGWTGEEVNAQECHSPEKVESTDSRSERLAEFTIDMAKAPDVDPKDLREHFDGVEHARLIRQSAPWAREIKALEQDREAYQKKYDLWIRHDKAWEDLKVIMHDGYAPSWLETTGGDTYEIQRTHWGGVGGPFTPNLPGNCGEYRGAWGEACGEVWIDKESLDRFLGAPDSLPAAGAGRREARKEETRQKYKKPSEVASAFKKKNQGMSDYRVLELVAPKIDMKVDTLRKALKKYYPNWAK